MGFLRCAAGSHLEFPPDTTAVGYRSRKAVEKGGALALSNKPATDLMYSHGRFATRSKALAAVPGRTLTTMSPSCGLDAALWPVVNSSAHSSGTSELGEHHHAVGALQGDTGDINLNRILFITIMVH